MTKTPIVLIGGGGHCLSAIEVIEQDERFSIMGILDVAEKVGEKILDYEIIGTDDELEKILSHCKNFAITVGQIKSNTLRKIIFNKVKKVGGLLPVIIAPDAKVSKHATIGAGSMLFYNTTVNAGVNIGENCIINTGAIIEHESKIGSHSHISTGAIINGQCNIGEGSFVGSGTVISNNIRLGEGALIGAGSVVIKDTQANSLYAGNPASFRKGLL